MSVALVEAWLVGGMKGQRQQLVCLVALTWHKEPGTLCLTFILLLQAVVQCPVKRRLIPAERLFF
jgi:hypothetical protein